MKPGYLCKSISKECRAGVARKKNWKSLPPEESLVPDVDLLTLRKLKLA
eukprot:CAMPEP_0184500372 /NCGR_PEP_ID=MMETSP0113_2-20130426/44565_1 /TAXON_ID=91329 /ORGANISM="Norrisiella sphaerica, Strain BC52" /LENGTH=48 /DNA_ID= /DNA_START= /DNA_END= /DNA_ORIENTATION=